MVKMNKLLNKIFNKHKHKWEFEGLCYKTKECRYNRYSNVECGTTLLIKKLYVYEYYTCNKCNKIKFHKLKTYDSKDYSYLGVQELLNKLKVGLSNFRNIDDVINDNICNKIDSIMNKDIKEIKKNYNNK